MFSFLTKFGVLTMLLTVAMTIATPAQADIGIWPGHNNWNADWENKYSQWIEEQAKDSDFFKTRNIRIDCVDVVYAYRWIFSRINDLKAVATLHDNSVVNNNSENPIWSRLPTSNDWQKDAKFLAALDYVLQNVSTYTANRDSYPVEITAEALQPGAFYLEHQHHTQMIAKTSAGRVDQMPLEFIQATVPRHLQTMTRLGYWDGHAPANHNSGFRRFLWPNTPAQKMPFYSLDQYNIEAFVNAQVDEMTFTTVVYFKLSPNLDYKKMIATGLNEVVQEFQTRDKEVKEGLAACSQLPKGCVDGTQSYEDYSTPSRDKRVQDLIDQIAVDVGNARTLPGQPHLFWNHFFYTTTVFEYKNHPVRLQDLYVIWRNKMFSSNPNDSYEKRWGFDQYKFVEWPQDQ